MNHVSQSGHPLVETRALNLTLSSGGVPLHILRDVSFRMEAGEVVAVVGPSGSGKTSLLMVLGGLERATSGEVIVGGESVIGRNEDQLALFRRRHLGIVFQNFNLIPSMTAIENVSLALELQDRGLSLGEVRGRAEAALGEVGLGERLDHLPSALSGGEQQRVGLARSIVTRPRLLLADEPTGNLDQETGANVVGIMLELARRVGTGILLITHDPSLAARADRRLHMNRGQLSEERAPAP